VAKVGIILNTLNLDFNDLLYFGFNPVVILLMVMVQTVQRWMPCQKRVNALTGILG
jgi:hypothetical protein